MTSCYEEGSPDFPICFIGEAPSFMEIREQRPFVGPAGGVFDRCLHAAGIPRARAYIINVFETEVRKKEGEANKIFSKNDEILWTSTKGFTELGRVASEGCRTRFKNFQGNVSVPMGGPALTLALEARAITKWRGSIIPSSEEFNKRKLIPTIHPAAVLHGSPEWRFYIISDFKKAKREMEFPEIRALTRKLIIDPTYDECIAYLKRCLDAPEVNTDIEVLNRQVDCFSLATDPSEAICIPMIDSGFEHRWSEEEDTRIWALYARILGAPHIAKVNQNISFDLATLLQLNKIVPRGVFHDPMVAHSIMYPALSKSLGTLCSMYTDEPYYKDDGELKAAPTIDDFKKRWEYNAKDSTVSLECWRALQPMVEEEGYRPTYDMTVNMIGSLVFMMANGIKVNTPALARTRVEAAAKRVIILQELAKAFARPIITEAPKKVAEKRAIAASGAINVNSPKQLCGYFYGEKGFRPYLNQAGAQTVDDIALSRIARRYDLPEARLMQDYRKLEKVISTYLGVKYDQDNRLRSSFNIRGTWTGRLSSSQTIYETGMNFQNLTEEFRSFLESDLLYSP